MKHKYIILLFIALCVASCGKKGTAKLSGEIKGLMSTELYLYGQDGTFAYVDTIPVRNGKFNCKINVDTLSSVFLLINSDKEYPIFLDKNDHIRIKGNATNIESLKVSGNDADDDFEDFKKSLTKDGSMGRLSFSNVEMGDATLQSKAKEFISKHPKSPVSVYLLEKYFVHQNMPDYGRIEEIIKGLDPALRNSSHIIQISDYITRWEKSKLGAIAPPFSINDADGITVSRSSEPLRSKYILLYFWASWASNRAQTTAELKQLYETFGNNPKFVMVGISLDTDKGEWKRCIQQDGMKGVQLCDRMGFNSPTVGLYAVSNLPAYFLIAPDGIILARDMQGEILRRQIQAALR